MPKIVEQISSNKINKPTVSDTIVDISREKLLYTEYQHYLSIGRINYKQNWLELFTADLVSELFKTMSSCSDNIHKQTVIGKRLKPYGFYDVGLGTNVYTVANPVYPGVVFKIALDEGGLADNFNDALLCEDVNRYLIKHGLKPKYTKVLARHPSGIVSVQERKILVTDDIRMAPFTSEIMDYLRVLSKKYLIIDLAPGKYVYNYGIDRNGEWCFIDASDLFPLSKLPKKIRCHHVGGGILDPRNQKPKRCGGKLHYENGFALLVCEKCGAAVNPIQYRPTIKGGVQVMSFRDSFTHDMCEEMHSIELRQYYAMCNIKAKSKNVSALPVSSAIKPTEEKDTSVSSVWAKMHGKTFTQAQTMGETEDSADKSEAPYGKLPAAVAADESDDTPTTRIFGYASDDDDSDETYADDSDVYADDEEDDDDDTVSREEYWNRGRIRSGVAPIPPKPKTEESKTVNAPMAIVKDSNRLQYRLKEVGEDGRAKPGIYIRAFGDPNKAYEKYGLGIYYLVDNDHVIEIAPAASIKGALLRAIEESVKSTPIDTI